MNFHVTVAAVTKDGKTKKREESSVSAIDYQAAYQLGLSKLSHLMGALKCTYGVEGAILVVKA
jgi:hypothetical protein